MIILWTNVNDTYVTEKHDLQRSFGLSGISPVQDNVLTRFSVPFHFLVPDRNLQILTFSLSYYSNLPLPILVMETKFSFLTHPHRVVLAFYSIKPLLL